MTDLIRLVDVRKEYRLRAETIHAVDGISLTLRSGSVTGLVGPSGSGKSTLINLIVGWDRPDGGAVERSDELGDDWASIAVVPQELGLLPELSLEENIDLPLRVDRSLVRSRTDLLARLHLDHLGQRLPEETSLGEQQRVAVARAVVGTPRVIVADEPTSHQDEDHALDVAALLHESAEAGSAVLIATHDERVLAGVDTVVRIEDGRRVDLVEEDDA